MDEQDEWFARDVLQDERDVMAYVQRQRAHRMARLFKQGLRRFRLHNPRGHKTTVVKISVVKGTAIVHTSRGERAVALHNLYPLV